MTANIEYPRGIDFDPFDESLRVQDTLVLHGSDAPPQLYVLVGSPCAGKTYMLKSMMHIFESRKQFSWGITFAEPDGFSWMPSKSVHRYDESYFQKYINNLRQKQFERSQKYGQWRMPPNYVVFDDHNGIFTEYQQKFMVTHRQTNTTVFILCHQLASRGSSATSLRANTTCTMMWPTTSISAVKAMYDHCGGKLTYEEFVQALSACREKQYSCLCIKTVDQFSPLVGEEISTIVAPTFPEGFQLKF